MNRIQTLLSLAVLIAACGNAVWTLPAAAWPEEGRAKLIPTLADLNPGESQQFRAILLPGRMQVSRPVTGSAWSVNGIPGGNETVGQIDAQGLYHAPATAPSPTEVHISVLVTEAPNKTLFGTVRISGGARYRHDTAWPEAGLVESGLKKPLRIALDSTGQVLLTEAPMGRVHQFTREGAYVGLFGKNRDGKTPSEICMLSVSPAGTVFTGDVITGPPRINAYDPYGVWLYGFAPKGSRDGMVVQPAGIAFHPDGRIYLADMDAMRISLFSTDHKFLRYLHERAEEGNRTNFPSDLAFDAAGDLFVTSAFGPCEKVDAETGERVLAFAYPYPPDGLMFVDDICIDRWNNVLLAVRSGADPVASGPFQGGVASILRFTNAGDFLEEITLRTPAPAWISIAVDQDDRLYAAYATEAPETPAGADEPGEPAAGEKGDPLARNGLKGGVEVLVLE